MPLDTLTVCTPKASGMVALVPYAVAAAESGLSPKPVFVVFKETAWENWAFSGGHSWLDIYI
jgi:hypothetical protein